MFFEIVGIVACSVMFLVGIMFLLDIIEIVHDDVDEPEK